MKYKCENCGHVTELGIVVRLVKCVDCDSVTVYKRADLMKLMEEEDET